MRDGLPGCLGREVIEILRGLGTRGTKIWQNGCPRAGLDGLGVMFWMMQMV